MSSSEADRQQCDVCGETRMPGWDVCPACGHPYPAGDPDADDRWS